MMCEHELKQALLDIEFLQECNNAVNLALSVTRRELAATKAELAAEREKREQAESQLQKVVNIFMSSNVSPETYQKAKAALEDKP